MPSGVRKGRKSGQRKMERRGRKQGPGREVVVHARGSLLFGFCRCTPVAGESFGKVARTLHKNKQIAAAAAAS